MERVREMIDKRSRGRKLVIYGADSTGDLLCRIVQSMGLKIDFFVDRAYSVMGACQGKPVSSPSILKPNEHFVLIISSANHHTVSSMKWALHEDFGYKWGDWFLWDDDVSFDIVVNGVKLGKGTTVPSLLLTASASKILYSIGRYVSINESCQISFDHYMGLSTSFHIPHVELDFDGLTVMNRITIGHDVWIGANAFINASKVKNIGNGAIVASGAVVINDVPPYAIVAGVPAKVKKYRFTPKQIDILERVCWWEWDDETLSRNAHYFTQPENFFIDFKGCER